MLSEIKSAILRHRIETSDSDWDLPPRLQMYVFLALPSGQVPPSQRGQHPSDVRPRRTDPRSRALRHPALQEHQAGGPAQRGRPQGTGLNFHLVFYHSISWSGLELVFTHRLAKGSASSSLVAHPEPFEVTGKCNHPISFKRMAVKPCGS